LREGLARGWLLEIWKNPVKNRRSILAPRRSHPTFQWYGTLDRFRAVDGAD
jgi:hypothetical protein